MTNRSSILAAALLSLIVMGAEAGPKVRIETTLGPITLELAEDKAPKTVANFLEYTRQGFYNGTVFHRVIDNFMIQGGGFTADFQQKPTRAPIPNEADNGLKNLRGTVAMARTNDPGSATAQFFINVKDNAALDYKSATPQGWGYAVFGKVIEGMDTVDKIRKVATGAGGPGGRFADVPAKPVLINSAMLLPTIVPSAPTAPPQPAK